MSRRIVEAGLLLVTAEGEARAGDDLDARWGPAKDPRRPASKVCQHMIRSFDSGGERSAAGILAKVGAQGDVARELAYRLFALCERKKWSAEALGYNALVTAWPELLRLAAERSADGGGERAQGELRLG